MRAGDCALRMSRLGPGDMVPAPRLAVARAFTTSSLISDEERPLEACDPASDRELRAESAFSTGRRGIPLALRDAA